METKARSFPSPAQIRAARGWLDLSQTALATEVGLSKRTLVRIEAGELPTHGETLGRIRAALEDRGVEFLFEDEAGVGIKCRVTEGPKRTEGDLDPSTRKPTTSSR